jgi:hypothetical protein
MARKVDVSIGTPLQIVAGGRAKMSAMVIFAHPVGSGIAVRVRTAASPGAVDLALSAPARTVEAGPPRGVIKFDDYWEFSFLLPFEAVDPASLAL